MIRFKLFKTPLGALALGGLLLAGPVRVTGQPQEKPQAQQPRFSNQQPFPWPSFLGVYPEPGLYSTRLKLIDISIASNSAMGGDEVLPNVRELFDNEQTYCITGEEPLEDWLQELGEGDCTAPELQVNGSRFSMEGICSDSRGDRMELRASGEITTTRADTTMWVTGTEQSVGDITLSFISRTQRLGECG